MNSNENMWTLQERLIRQTYIKENTSELRTCKLLDRIQERYYDDPISAEAPEECATLIEERHVSQCVVCQHLKGY